VEGADPEEHRRRAAAREAVIHRDHFVLTPGAAVG